MCGVIGYHPITGLGDVQIEAFTRLFDQSRIRGHHAYGIATSKRALLSYNWKELLEHFNPVMPTIGHTRYCQSGDWKVMTNNQPLEVANYKLAMNGVIHMGTKEEYEAAFNVKCSVDNDSEIFLQRLVAGEDPLEFIRTITGSFAATWLRDNTLFAGRNARRPLWKCKAFGAMWYASTRDIFYRAGFPTPQELPYPHVEYV